MRHFFRYFFVLSALTLSLSITAQTTQWRDIYKAKKKDTIYGIAQKYNITLDELKEANPEMKKADYQLKKGDFVFIPFEKTKADIEAEKNKPVMPVRSDIQQRAIRVGVMLPLHNVDGDGRRMVEYYRGLLMACDSLRRQGISTDVRAWNVAIDSDIRETLLQEGASQCDIIFGPLYTKQVKPLANFCKTYDIRMVIPFSISGDDVEQFPQIFQVYQSGAWQNQAMISAFVERFPNHHAVFIDCNDSTSRKGSFTMALRKQLDESKITYNVTNLKTPDDAFSKAFNRSKPNVVILNTGRSPELNQTLAKLNILRQRDAGVAITLFGYTDWLLYTEPYGDYFHRYDTYIPTNFYYNAQSRATQQLEQNYKQWFKEEMLFALPHFALTGYDHGQFFLRGLHQYGTAFRGTKDQRVKAALQTPLYFKPASKTGGMQNSHFMLVHYKPNKTIEAINY
ncbi:MAG: ABC transporter substrate-binding protein [Prevotella sp.]|nr:ABC transporter substrate-binding protein [Prevotella sp.]